MIIAFFIYVCATGFLVGVAALGLERACRVLNVPARGVWLGAMLLLVALTQRGMWRTGEMTSSSLLPGQTISAAPPATAENDAWSVAQRRVTMVVGDVTRAVERMIEASPPVAHTIDVGGAIVWGLGTALLVGFMLLVNARMMTSSRSWPVTMLHGVSTRLSENTGPLVAGVVRPMIVIPQWLLARDSDAQQLAVTHEHEHVRGRDPLLLAMGCGVVALLFWQPMAWWMFARLQLAMELDCDGRVLRRGVEKQSYGTMLIDLAGHCTGVSLGMAALADGPSHLERRLVAMTTRKTRFAHAGAAGLAACATLALVVACESRMPTNADVRQMDAAKATAAAQQLGVTSTDSGPVMYYVDGKIAAAEDAKAITADQIVSVRVNKAAGGGGGNVYLTTRGTAHDQPLLTGSEAPARSASSDTGDALKEKAIRSHTDRFAGVAIIDGRRTTIELLKSWPRGDIESIEVLKGAAAIAAYGSDAAEGVIILTTKKK